MKVNFLFWGGSPGLVVMGEDSCLKGSNPCAEYWMDWHFFNLICCKNCIDVCLKRPRTNEKRPGLAHFWHKKQLLVVILALAVPAAAATWWARGARSTSQIRVVRASNSDSEELISTSAWGIRDQCYKTRFPRLYWCYPFTTATSHE